MLGLVRSDEDSVPPKLELVGTSWNHGGDSNGWALYSTWAWSHGAGMALERVAGWNAVPVFISYSHADKEVAETLALHLVQAKQSVWIDTWELNAGDSLIAKIEGAIGGADAILVLLSENSVNSEWCRKELRAGLIRELEEKPFW